jgi:hypothetical protein
VAFFKTPAPKPSTRLDKNELILSVGWHAFINSPGSAGRRSEPVPINDSRGEAIANDLVDGQEVEILAWHPHASQGLAYQIRRLTDGKVWWLRAVYLRRAREAA